MSCTPSKILFKHCTCIASQTTIFACKVCLVQQHHGTSGAVLLALHLQSSSNNPRGERVTKTGNKQIKFTQCLEVRMLQLSQGLSRQVTINIWAAKGSFVALCNGDKGPSQVTDIGVGKTFRLGGGGTVELTHRLVSNLYHNL